ncbi:MAG: RdgB/HAM1 family non-canonical purine NTP pyrophosphatase [Euryarchaeota archaeon]|nr:RdgB/HAM1 family non-canonical purine NTP pyrophosphatase [Euryarchaeota archaeon]
MRIRFVTTNPGKIEEARARLGPRGVDVRPHAARPTELQADTLEEVARHKAESVRGRAPAPYFVEDAGLFVDALGGFPGVYSRHAFDTIGCRGILRLLAGVPARRRAARFRAVIAYADRGGRLHLFEGTVKGRITARPRGGNGFGFDPIFEPHGLDRTFAELGTAEKGQASHRGRALDALAKHLAVKGRV